MHCHPLLAPLPDYLPDYRPASAPAGPASARFATVACKRFE